VSALALSFTFIFVVIAMAVSIWQKLGLERDIAVGTIRSAVQLLAVGYVLQFVFRADLPLLVFLFLGIMIAVASWNAGKHGQGLTGIGWRILLTILITESVTLGLFLFLHMIQWSPQYVIPFSGMIIGNAMTVAGLFLNQMNREVQSEAGKIEVLLALGATARQAIHDSLKHSIRSSMIPTIDVLKTVGLVQLPGMMTGMIIAGASPLEAVRYQILIMFSLSSSAAITSMLLALLSYRLWFTKDLRLKRIT
jgi:putative ABC transport system permease protein